jgi:hypothetical protein
MFALNSYDPMILNQNQFTNQQQPYHYQQQNYYNNNYYHSHHSNSQSYDFNSYNNINNNVYDNNNNNNNNNLNYNFINNNNNNNNNSTTTTTTNNNNNNNINSNNNVPQPNGGVSLVLDYDIDQMVKFLSWVSFGLLKRNSNPSLNFQKSLNSVLSATRLPKSTLLLAINYLSNKMDNDLLNNNNNNNNNLLIIKNEDDIFKILITSLILSNKFNDDKTFRNKSWSDATNLPLLEINKLERIWLMDCNYELFKTNSFSMVESCWNTWCMKNIQSINNNNNNNNSIDYSNNQIDNFYIPLTPISTAPSSPNLISNSNSNYNNNNNININNFVPNQIFENPFQSNSLNLNNNQSIISPSIDFQYMNDYYNIYNKSKIMKSYNFDDLSYYNNNNNNNINNNIDDNNYTQTINYNDLIDQSYNYNFGYGFNNNNHNHNHNYNNQINNNNNNNNYNIYSNPSFMDYNNYNYCAASAC